MSILSEFREQKEKLSNFEKKINSLINELIISEEIQIHQISSRVKSETSLKGKVDKKKGKYKSLFDVTDCVGIRIVTYFEHQVDQIANMIEQEFFVDRENSIDKRKLEIDRFGYKSLHYVISLNQSRSKLKEYSAYLGYKAEIQIRTILQHAWAEIEHDLGYKSEIGTPDFLRRDFFRVAALLETADKEFGKINSNITQYQNKVKKELKKNPSKFEINQDTLAQYLRTSKIIKTINNRISYGRHQTENGNLGDLDYVLETLEKYNIKSISMLNDLLIERADEIVDFYRNLDEYEGSTSGETGSALGIHGLVVLILLENNDTTIYQFDEYSTFNEMNTIRISYSK